MRRIYLDGNSLGPPSPEMAEALRPFVEPTSGRADLIGGWNTPRLVGPAADARRPDRAGWSARRPARSWSATTPPCSGTSCSSRRCGCGPAATWIVTEEGNFPTDRHVIDAVAAAQCGLHGRRGAGRQLAAALVR